jgi:hypothetical protein
MMTFLVDPDFRISASQLDNARLGKQRVEALQILLLLRKLHLVALLIDVAIPAREISISRKRMWIKELVRMYRESPVRILAQRDGVVLQVSSDKPHDKLGWFSHPIVAMWFGYEEALVEYLHAHLSEWIKRGFVNTMIFQDFQGKVVYPDWIFESRVHDNHRGALLKKEIVRKEKRWYTLKDSFVNSSPFTDYIWTPDEK